MYNIKQRKLDFRVSTFLTVHGETVVFRVLNKQNLMVGLDKLGMNKEMLKSFQDGISRPHGISIVIGPTGAGIRHTFPNPIAAIPKNISIFNVQLTQ